VAHFFEQLGSAAAPALAGLIAVRSSLGTAIMSICTVAWLLCFVMLLFVTAFVPKDIAALRAQQAERARQERP
jgi:fucose permease